MAKGLYEIKLKECLIPAASEEDALETRNGSSTTPLDSQEVETSMVVTEEHTLKLFILAKTMMDADRFTYKEIVRAVSAVAQDLGYFARAEALAECVVTWTERIGEDLTLHEMEEWLIG